MYKRTNVQAVRVDFCLLQIAVSVNSHLLLWIVKKGMDMKIKEKKRKGGGKGRGGEDEDDEEREVGGEGEGGDEDEIRGGKIDTNFPCLLAACPLVLC